MLQQVRDFEGASLGEMITRATVEVLLQYDGLALCILKYLDDPALVRCCATCSQWRRLSSKVLRDGWKLLCDAVRVGGSQQRTALTAYTQVAIGCLGTACLVVKDGVARGCGTDYDGQLGVGSCNKHWSPCWFPTFELVKGDIQGSKCISAALGWRHSAFATEDGQVYFSGIQPGGIQQSVAVPQLHVHAGLPLIEEVAAGVHYTLLLAHDGRVFSSSSYGADLKQIAFPEPDSRMHTVAAGSSSAFAIDTQGRLWRALPQPGLMSGLGSRSVSQVSAGFEHALAVTVDGALFAWGASTCGQLGLGDRQNHEHPQQVPGVAAFLSVAAGTNHSAAISCTGELLAWGHYNYIGTDLVLAELPRLSLRVQRGQPRGLGKRPELIHYSVGLSRRLPKHCCTPCRVEALHKNVFVRVAAGAQLTLAVSRDGRVYGFGPGTWYYPTQLGACATCEAAGRTQQLELWCKGGMGGRCGCVLLPRLL